MTTRYYEDVEVGEVHDCGSYEVTEAEVREFAERYDPQPYHTDPEAASETIFDGLVASGWHTAAMCMRQYVDGFLGDLADPAAIGVDDLRWHEPVRPGDVLSIRVEVTETFPSERRDGRGHVRPRVTAVNQDDVVVVSRTDRLLVRRRDAPEQSTERVGDAGDAGDGPTIE